MNIRKRGTGTAPHSKAGPKTLKREERFNAVSHLVGAAAALTGAVVLIVFASLKGDAWKIVSFSIYGLTLFLLYMASSLYHSLRGKDKALFRKLDHAAIYLLIAGTYTPLALISLHDAWRWSIFGTVWGIAVAGIVMELVTVPRGRRIVPVIVYIAMGWIGLAALGPLLRSLSSEGLMWLLAGGVFYTSGVAFYILGSTRPFYHFIWHLFVLAGSLCHYVMIYLYIL